MKKITIFISILAMLLLAVVSGYSQVTEISGQFRPRYEMRHGYGTLIPDGVQAANFISQRSRLNLKFSNDDFRVGFSLQNVGVWGETGTLRTSDVNGTSVHEAWGQFIFSQKVALKVGRQEIIYDDHRIMGSVDWAQQGRSHDAAVLTIKPKEECSLDIGIAYNAMSQSYFKQYYTINNYKALQYAHWHRNFDGLGVSILFLNNGMPWISGVDTTETGNPKEKIAYSQTIGTRVTYKKEKFKANAAFYYQTGKVTKDTTGDGTAESTKKISAIYFALDASYKFSTEFTAGLGFEYLSGNSMKDPSDKDQAFKPLYGTNHKFNGWMDYFYVGSFMNSVGLLDIYIPVSYKKDKFSAGFNVHMFRSASDIYAMGSDGNMKDYSSVLGTELDFVFGYAIVPNAVLKAGYSQMFATESMQVLKDGNFSNTNNWAWIMIDFKPTFFKSDKK